MKTSIVGHHDVQGQGIHIASFPMQLGLTNNLAYSINGALLILLFLLSRVLFVPITVTIYAAQYHNWGILKALGHMRRICHLCNLIQFTLQSYWFFLLLRLAAGVLRTWTWHSRSNRGQTDTFRTGSTRNSSHNKKLL